MLRRCIRHETQGHCGGAGVPAAAPSIPRSVCARPSAVSDPRRRTISRRRFAMHRVTVCWYESKAACAAVACRSESCNSRTSASKRFECTRTSIRSRNGSDSDIAPSCWEGNARTTRAGRTARINQNATIVRRQPFMLDTLGRFNPRIIMRRLCLRLWMLQEEYVNLRRCGRDQCRTFSLTEPKPGVSIVSTPVGSGISRAESRSTPSHRAARPVPASRP